MILEAVVYDFQSIEYLKLDFGLITVFRGESRQGKSAFIRALRCLVTNPKGSYFIRTSAKSARVEVKTDRGYVSWEKSRSTSAIYKVQVGNGPVQEFEKNTEVPREVFSVLNMPDLVIDKDLEVSLHFSSQHESPFLIPPLWGTASSIAKALGKITNVDRASQAMRLCAADLKEAKVELGSTVEKIEDAEKRLVGFGELDALIVAADRIKRIQGEVEVLSRADCTPQLEMAKQSIAMLRRSSLLRELLLMVPFETAKELDELRLVYDSLSAASAAARGAILAAQNSTSGKVSMMQDVQKAQEDLDKFCVQHESCPLCDGKGALTP